MDCRFTRGTFTKRRPKSTVTARKKLAGIRNLISRRSSVEARRAAAFLFEHRIRLPRTGMSAASQIVRSEMAKVSSLGG
jgi:hypothetical protein